MIYVGIFTFKMVYKTINSGSERVAGLTLPLPCFSSNLKICKSKLILLACHKNLEPKKQFFVVFSKNVHFWWNLIPKMDSMTHFTVKIQKLKRTINLNSGLTPLLNCSSCVAVWAVFRSCTYNCFLPLYITLL